MKTAIITGGSRGIGEAMTLKLGEMGYNVVHQLSLRKLKGSHGEARGYAR
ncbi:MAG: SDR family NAD(P)-dependent oxidoreductase [Firmicutes bacterium]|nr:SDR family NAD(P)-dependent oxidoreductase [Bacillota bacterium]